MIQKRDRQRYTEDEAAAKLGMSVDEFRRLVRQHIACEADVPPAVVFEPTDLIVLRVLASQARETATAA